jgi:PAS domain S-box-containing protein
MISVLYVDDEKSLLEIARLYLEESGDFRVGTAASAAEALASFGILSYDAIVSDYMMPGMDGIAFLKAVRARSADMPFILFTGRGREEVVIEAINNGADFYLQKGGDPEAQFAELKHKIRQAVRRRNAEVEQGRSEEIFSHLFLANPSLEAISDFTTGCLIDVNDTWTRISGYSRDEVIGKSTQDLGIFIDYGDRERMAKALSRNGTVQSIETRIRTKSGEIRTLEFTGQRIRVGDSDLLFSQAVDITGRKRTEDAMRENEEKFRDIFNNLHDAVLLLELDEQFRHLTFVDVNDVACRMTGYTREELLAMTAADLDHGQYSKPREVIDRDLAEQGTSTFESVYIRKDGSRFPVELSVHIFQLRGKRVTVAIVRDISDRKAAGTAIQAILMGMVGTTGINALDKITETIGTWLGAECVMVGEIQPDHQSVKVLSMLLDGKAVDGFSYTLRDTPCENVAEKGFCFYPKDSALLFPKAKDIVDLNMQAYAGTPLRNSRGEVIGILCALSRRPMEILPYVRKIMDIIAVKAAAEVERNHIERELRGSEEWFRSFIETSPDLIWEVDLQGMFRYVSPRVATILGYTPEEITGRSITDLVPDEIRPLAMQEFGRLFSPEGPLLPFEMPARHRDGSTLLLEIRPSLAGTGPGAGGFRGVAVDITERKRAEETLSRANRQLALLSSITRHDALNKISVILGFLKIAEMKCTDPAITDFLKKIGDNTRIIRELMEFTRVYQDLGAKEPQWLDLDAAMPRSHVPPSVSLTADVQGISLYADPMLEKVFFNLLDNAVRHGERVTEIHVSSRQSEENLVIVWEDNGIGIAADEKERIFERGFGKNTGLGMFLVREILSLTGITITETGEPGAGARFEITVPHGSWRVLEKPADKS